LTENGGGLEFKGGRWVLLALVIGLALFVGLVVGADDGGGYHPPRTAPWSGWRIIGLTVLVLVGLLAAGLIVYALARLGISILDRWNAHRCQQALDRLEVTRTANRLDTDRARLNLDAARLAPWTEHGRLGALVRQLSGGWQVVNLDAEGGPLLLRDSGTVDRVLADPLTLAQLQARHGLEMERARASAYPSLTSYNQRLQIAGGDIGEREAAAVQWPDRVWLRDLAPEPATLGGLVLGVTVGEDGQPHPVTAGLTDLVHIAVGGSSGWGKSVFLRALALQSAMAAEPCKLALVDLEGVTFSPFANCDRLLFPVADTEGAALAIMARLVEEMDRRKALYSDLPGVDSLTAYNARTDGDPLAPVVCLIDEATALLSDRSVHNATRTLALRARKYGLWLVLGGQDWKAASVDTAIRNQLSSRVHFKAQSASQSRVLLGDGCAAAIETPGRAFAQLPGRPLTEIQAPMVSLADIEAALTGQAGPAVELPEAHVLLSELDARLVLWAVNENEGRFSVRAVADAHLDLVSRGDVQALADRLIPDGWLIMPTKAGMAPEVTIDLEIEAQAVLGMDGG